MNKQVYKINPTFQASTTLIDYSSKINNFNSFNCSFQATQDNVFLMSSVSGQLSNNTLKVFGQEQLLTYYTILQFGMNQLYADSYSFAKGAYSSNTSMVINYNLNDSNALIAMISYMPKVAYFGQHNYACNCEMLSDLVSNTTNCNQDLVDGFTNSQLLNIDFNALFVEPDDSELNALSTDTEIENLLTQFNNIVNNTNPLCLISEMVLANEEVEILYPYYVFGANNFNTIN